MTFFIWYAGVFADCKVIHNILDWQSQLIWCILWRNSYISPPIPFMNSKCYGLHSLWHFMGFWGWESSPVSSGVTFPSQQTTFSSRCTSLKLTFFNVVVQWEFTTPNHPLAHTMLLTDTKNWSVNKLLPTPCMKQQDSIPCPSQQLQIFSVSFSEKSGSTTSNIRHIASTLVRLQLQPLPDCQFGW